MRWLIVLISLVISATSIHATELAHTGAPCKEYRILKKEHPSQRIFYETISGKKCYHVHVNTQTGDAASSSGGLLDASSITKKRIFIPKSYTRWIEEYYNWWYQPTHPEK